MSYLIVFHFKPYNPLLNKMNKIFWLQQTMEQHLDGTCTTFGAADYWLQYFRQHIASAVSSSYNTSMVLHPRALTLISVGRPNR